MSIHPFHIGKYELQQCLGRGGMGEVWKAFDQQLQRHVAIKLLHPDLQATPDFLTRFEREARIIASLHHPNIVHIAAVFTALKLVFYAAGVLLAVGGGLIPILKIRNDKRLIRAVGD